MDSKHRFLNWNMPVFDTDGWAYPNEHCKNVRIHSYGWRCQHPNGLKLGKNTDIGCFTFMNAKYGIEIGDNVQLGSHCSIYSINTENDTRGKVIIGENSLIGSHTIILPNTIINPNSKIPAGSIMK